MLEEDCPFFADLIEENGRICGDKPFILYEDQSITFKQFDEATCRVANALADFGAKPGDGVAIFLNNCPEYLYIFYGAPRGGFYSVPINVALKGDGLHFVLTNSEVKTLIAEDFLYDKIVSSAGTLKNIEWVFIRRHDDRPLPAGTRDIRALLEAPPAKPGYRIQPGTLEYIIYTSGTTGLPKGVVTRQAPGFAKSFKDFAGTLIQPDEVLYTCLPLFHANALIVSAGWAMGSGRPLGLDERFSASRFWDRIRLYGATTFNGIGAMLSILMKQPPSDRDRDHKVRIVHSAACPSNIWGAFEKRFGVKLFEGYGAVDGGGIIITNPGTGPVGSVGKPAPEMVYRLVDEDENDVPLGEPGELIVKAPEKQRVVEYFNNPEASERKVLGGWIRTGDMFWQDKEGNLYFADRKNDCMRRRGENISSWEVENIVEKMDEVQECAAFGVPSEMAEDEVMIWVKPKDGVYLDPKKLVAFCEEKMAHYMVPRYIDIVNDIPRTNTLRAQKAGMKKQGVTERTWDRENPEGSLKTV